MILLGGYLDIRISICCRSIIGYPGCAMDIIKIGCTVTCHGGNCDSIFIIVCLRSYKWEC